MRKLTLVLMTAVISCSSVLNSFAAWVDVGNNDWKYQIDNGTYVTNSWMKHTDGKWYYLGADTMMKKGWFLDATGKWYFMDANGAMQIGLIHVDEKAYFMNDNGDLFVGDKIVNGKSYNFGLYGTTNGIPYANNQFRGNGEAMNEITTDEDASTIYIVPHGVLEKTEAIGNILDDLGAQDSIIEKLVVKKPVSTGSTSVKVEVTIAPQQEAIKNDIETVQTVVITAVQSIVESADTSSEVTISIGGKTLKKSADKIMGYVNSLADSWITEDKFNELKTETAKISVLLDGVTVTYNISF